MTLPFRWLLFISPNTTKYADGNPLFLNKLSPGTTLFIALVNHSLAMILGIVVSMYFCILATT